MCPALKRAAVAASGTCSQVDVPLHLRVVEAIREILDAGFAIIHYIMKQVLALMFLFQESTPVFLPPSFMQDPLWCIIDGAGDQGTQEHNRML